MPSNSHFFDLMADYKRSPQFWAEQGSAQAEEDLLKLEELAIPDTEEE